MTISYPKLFFFFLIFCCGLVRAQDQKAIDSLERLLEGNAPNRALTFYQLAEQYSYLDSIKAFEMVRKGLSLSTRRQDAYALAKGKFTLGSMYLDYKKRVRAINYFQEADSILAVLKKKDSSYRVLKLWVRSNFNIGVAISQQGKPDQLKYLEKIVPVAEKIQFYSILAAANTNLGIDFYNATQFEKAYQYFSRSAPYYEKSKNYEDFVTDRLIFTSCLLEMDSLVTAKQQLDRVATLLDSLSLSGKKQLYHTILGEYHYKTKDYNTAIANFKRAEELLGANLVTSNDMFLYIDFMKTYGAMGQYDKAIDYAERTLQLAKEGNNQIIEAEIHKELSSYFHKLGQVDRALENLRTYVAISDSLNIPELEKEINRLESKYQSERKEREILQLQNTNDTVELQLLKKQSQNYLLLIISLGLLVLAVTTYMGYRNFKKRDQLKTAEIKELKYEQESKVYHAMLEGQESERKRLAIDLHDGLAGRLSATRLKLEKLANKSAGSGQVKGVVEAVSNIDASLSELRSIAMNLMPETLFRYGLKNAIEDYCASIGRSVKHIKFIVQFYDAGFEIPSNTSLTIYRIFQELINNAVKHSKATEVLVQYLEEEECINITVEDNGKGFDQEKTVDKKGMGLNNLKTRVAYLNGEIDFFSSPNEGTTVHIVINR